MVIYIKVDDNNEKYSIYIGGVSVRLGHKTIISE